VVVEAVAVVVRADLQHPLPEGAQVQANVCELAPKPHVPPRNYVISAGRHLLTMDDLATPLQHSEELLAAPVELMSDGRNVRELKHGEI
jgi:hypothetical protein